MTDTDFLPWMTDIQQRVETALAASLPAGPHAATLLFDAMRYAALDGGKRVRPLLVYAAGECAGAAPAALDAVACAVELIHAYSLVHDDLPCMDDDVLRRGKPTVHVAFGEATAMLVGDALQALAFDVLTRAADAGAGAGATVGMVRTLAAAAGSLGMAGGQAIDLAATGSARMARVELETMHRMKTGAMLEASVMLGAACGPRLDDGGRRALARYAESMGLAFQVVDDVLDVEADSATLGKTAGKDADNLKPTYVSVLGLDASKALARALREEALAAIAPLGAGSRRLAELADLIVLRKS